jgi:hypothetical protein
MKLRLDLLKFLTSEDILEDAGFDVHRWSAEPVFAKTGVGFLKPATEEDKTEEMARSERLIGRLKERAAREAASLDSSEL